MSNTDNDETQELSAEEREKRMKAFEDEFNAASKAAYVLILEKLDAASAALREAEQIADEAGVPMCSHVSPFSQTYRPEGSEKKWRKKLEELGLDADDGDVSDMLHDFQILGYDYNDAGWTHSAVC